VGTGAAPVAHQQVLAQLDLQQAHLAAQGGLGNVQHDGSPGEAAQLCHAHKVFDLFEVHERAVLPRELSCSPTTFVPVAMLPQSPGVDPATCIPELEKCVKEYGAVGINLNPDPSGGHWNSPPLTDRHWYPIYEKMVEYDLPAMIHVSTSCNACFHTTGAHYLNADTTAFMQCVQGDLFKDFPTLKFLIPHGGGAVPYHWGRFRGLAQEMKKPLLTEHVLNNIFFDTCVYHQPGIDLLNTVIPVKNVLLRQRDDRRSARHRPDHGPLLRRHQALHRGLDPPQRRGQAPDL
jgi:hypothetical protein